MTRLGIAVSGGPNPAEIIDLVTLAESLGYESAWVAEGHGGDQFSVLSGCAMRTSTIQLGTAISSVYVRSIPTIAMAAATVDDLSNGRFILGLGSSHKVQVVPEHGVEYAKPITRLRESVAIIRMLLRTGQAQFDGETVKIENFDLWFTPRRPDIPIYAAAVFPKMMAVCGEIADGIILTRSTLKTGAEVKARLAEGAEVAGRDPSGIAITSLLPTAVADNRQDALAVMRPGLAFYAGFFPRYNQLIAEHGFAEEAAAIATAWAKGDRAGAERLVSDAMIDATSVVGTPEQCRERLEAYRQSGIDLPIISPFARGANAKATFEAAIRACAPV
ncbi:MAG: LLM class flavin-dependent oxidoreductase [Alphaproteobacteria bacterium]|nr:LLM class flavin-dependent oxidoreductase [Alphaproteobacteria bacterium]